MPQNQYGSCADMTPAEYEQHTRRVADAIAAEKTQLAWEMAHPGQQPPPKPPTQEEIRVTLLEKRLKSMFGKDCTTEGSRAVNKLVREDRPQWLRLRTLAVGAGLLPS